MKIFFVTLFFSVSLLSSLNAQDPFEFLFEASNKVEFIGKVYTVKETEYTTNNFDVLRNPDSLYTDDEDTIALFVTSKKIDHYFIHGKVISKVYDHSDMLLYTETIIHDSDGLITERSTKFNDLDVAMIMNTTTHYSYDSLRRITKVEENELERLHVKYDQNGVPINLGIDIGFGKINYVREELDTSYKYEISIKGKSEEEEGFFPMLSEKMNNSNKLSYVIYNKTNEGHYYALIEKDKGTNQIIKYNRFVRDNSGRLIEKQQKIDSKVHYHYQYQYNNKGQITMLKNLVSSDVLVAEIDDDGNIIGLPGENDFSEFEYDAQDNMIVTKKYLDKDKSDLWSVIIREILYE